METTEKSKFIGKRTDLDFSKHELFITETDEITIHYLRIPNTRMNSIKFINTNGIMAVTGDFGNWIFCREFHPTAKDFVSAQYWCEKLSIASSQVASSYDADKTEAAIKERLLEEDLDPEEKEWLENCLDAVNDEYEYIYRAYRETPNWIDGESVIFEKSVKPWLLCVFDGFDEICRRFKEIQDNNPASV